MLTQQDNDLLAQTGPGTPMGAFFRSFWLPALLPAELPEPDCAPVRFRLLGEDLVAFRDTSGRIAFMQNACPHRGASMFFGRNEEDGLRCVYHGWKFDVAGACVDMPNEPAESNFKHKIKAVAYPGVERGGLIWIYMGPADQSPEIPQLDWLDLTYEHKVINKWIQPSNYAQGVEGNIDSAHISFLHRNFDITPRNPRGARGILSPDGSPRLTIKETDFGFVYGARRQAGEEEYYWRLTPFMLPTYTTIPSPAWPRTCFMLIPLDDHNTWWFTASYNPDRPMPADRQGQRTWLIAGTWQSALNPENDFKIDREMQKSGNYTGIPEIRIQDMAMTDTMPRILDRTVEHLGTTDLAIITMRRLLMRLARQAAEGTAPYAALNGEVHRVRPLDVVDPEGELGNLMDKHREKFLELAPS